MEREEHEGEDDEREQEGTEEEGEGEERDEEEEEEPLPSDSIDFHRQAPFESVSVVCRVAWQLRRVWGATDAYVEQQSKSMDIKLTSYGPTIERMDWFRLLL